MTIKLHVDIPDSSKVIVPISMDSDLIGDKLAELINFLKNKNYDFTILVADSLHENNGLDSEAALAKGDNFLADNKALLKDVKVYRWNEYKEIKKDIFEVNKNLIESKATIGSKFNNMMIRTQKKCRISKDLTSSLNYQKEEYALFLSMSEFDYHLYPKAISDGMACLYDEFPNIKKPKYVHARISDAQANNIANFGLHKLKNPREQTNLPLVLRMAYENLETLLNTTEISEQAKDLFKQKVNNLFVITENKTNNKLIRSTFLSVS